MKVGLGKNVDPQRQLREIFTGEVHSHPHAQGEQMTLNLVKFSAGGRTKWHTHSAEQGLVIVEGRGIVATEAQEHVVVPGDVILIEANEKHWHGGTETSGMAHIAINQMSSETTVLEAVEAIRTPGA